MRMQRRRKKGQGEAASTPPLQAQFQSRPFQDANTLTNEQAAPPEMQLQPEQRGFDFASIPVFASSSTSSQPIQRQEEDSHLQMQSEPDAIQRMGEDDDEMQMKPESNSSINPLFKNLVQRDDLETPEPRISIQAKLTVGAPGDKYEQEADQVAHNVVQQINSPTADATQSSATVQRETVAEDDEVQMKPIVQRQELDGGIEAPTEIESSINQAKGGGQSLNAGLQRSMGQAMGADFSGVKVHTDSTADTLNQSLQAKAFTTGQHVFFKKGEYQPESAGGQELIAHELTHVVQQQSASVRTKPEMIQRAVTHSYPGNSNWEQIQAGATRARGILTAIANELAGTYHGKAIIGSLKDEDRSREKVEGKYGGNWNRLTDVARGTVVFRTFHFVQEAANYLQHSKWIWGTEGNDWRVKNRYTSDSPAEGGYRDIKYNFKVKVDQEGQQYDHVVELQLNCGSMMTAKGPGHALYDIARTTQDRLEFDANDSKQVEKWEKMILQLNLAAIKMDAQGRDDLSGVIEGIHDELEETHQIEITPRRQEVATEAMELVYQESDREITRQNTSTFSPVDTGHGPSMRSSRPQLT